MNTINKKFFKFSLIITIILIYLVIAAGAFVRMTGSGMGCPDWPKCFGYLVPPTKKSDLFWKKEYQYTKKQMIIYKEKLFYANEDFISKNSINLNNWSEYKVHDYSKFDVKHTWIEFLNRLLGALAGFSTLITFIFSLSFWKTKRKIVIFSFVSILFILFQAWLGKTVVDSNLQPVKISIHMMMALVIVFILIYLLYIVRVFEKNEREFK